MLLPNPADTVHRAWLYRLLSAIVDDRNLAAALRFKGGTCAAMRDLLDRFSVDLDFDLLDATQITAVRQCLEDIFTQLGLEIKDASQTVPQYFLRYPTTHLNQRSTIALDITVPPPLANDYEVVKLMAIDRFVPCQTVATMVANKLVTPLDRYQKHGSIAGRDIYDIHQFLLNDLPFKAAVIEERTGLVAADFFNQLKTFIAQRVTQTILDQDLNTLLPAAEFKRLRKVIKPEVELMLMMKIAN